MSLWTTTPRGLPPPPASDMKVRNRTFIVSSGSSGLGLAAAQELTKAGAFVSILDIKSPEPADPDAHVLYINTDISQVKQVEQAVEATISWTRRTGAPLGGVINGAGIGRPELTLSKRGRMHSVELWNETINVNLSGTFHLSRLAAKHLSTVPGEGQDGERGVIIMISSSVAADGMQGQVAYAASKGAIEAMTLPLARDLAPFAIRVVTIAPGLFTTPLTEQFKGPVADGLQQKGVLYPKRFGLPSEFASTVKWVMETGYVNAETLKVNGGIRVPASL